MPVYSPIMPALCSMLLVTYYTLNYASIIGLGLQESHSKLKTPFRQHWLSNNMPVYSPIMLALCSMFLVMLHVNTEFSSFTSMQCVQL